MIRVSTRTGSPLGRFAFLWTAVILICVPAFAVVYVDTDNASGTENGTSWLTAFRTIQAGVNAAVSSGGDVWVAEGTYVGTGGTVVEMKQNVRVYGGFDGTETLFSQRDWATKKAIIDGQGARRCVSFTGISATLDGFTITRGKSSAGGGVLAEFSTPTIKNCTFEDNSADNGGALDLFSNVGITMLSENVFRGNTAVAGGAARFRGCSSTFLMDCSFEDNSGDEGGAVFTSESSLSLSWLEFRGNTVTGGTGRGGIVCCVGSPAAGLYACEFQGNTGISLVNDEASPTIEDCVFAGNTGSVIKNIASSPTIRYSTLAWNRSMEGGIVSDSSSIPTVVGSILWRNGPAEILDSQKTAIVTYSCVRGGYAGEGNISSNPHFVDMRGGDLRLCPVSACLNAVSTGYPQKDIRGTSRPQGAKADMGAYEMVLGELPDNDADGMADAWETAQGLNPEFFDANMDPDGDGLTNVQEYQQGENTFFDGVYVDVSNEVGPWDGQSWATAYPTIQEGVNEAYARGGGDVWVATGAYVDTGDQVVTLKYGVSVYGGFLGKETKQSQRNWEANVTVIDGENVRRCVRGSNGAVLDGFTVRQGRGVSGGGMYNSGASPTVRYCVFELNQSTGQTTGGGGMYNANGSPNVSYCTFRENSSASYGGGMMNSQAPAQVSYCTFSDNTAAWYGGAMANVTSSPVVSVCRFLQNTAESTFATGGGAILNNSSSPLFTNCIFCGNSADSGAAICNQVQSSPQYMNCTIAGNVAGSESSGAVYNTGACSPHFTNCILWNESTAEVYNEGSGETPVLTYCVVQGGFSGVGNINSNPLLKNVAANDCRLKGGSPCLDAGTSVGAPSVDIDGTARPFDVPGCGAESPTPGYDIGAYEYTRVTGTVAIWATPATVPWSYIDGDGDTHTGTGTLVQSGIPVGTTLLTWQPLSNYDTPPQPEPEILAARNTVYFVAQYVRHLGTVAVNVTPEGAPWSFVDGDGATHSGSGDGSVSNVPTGDIVMTWGAVPLYDAPAPQTKPLSKNSTVAFSGAYVRQLGNVAINVTPDNAPWSFTDGDGGEHNGVGDSQVASIPTGTITLSWLAVTNYTAPANPSPQTLTKDGTVTFSGLYARHTGTVTVQVTPLAAPWTILDADGFTHNGAGNAILQGIPTGSVEITWLATPNYTEPAKPPAQALLKDGSVTFTTTYARNKGTVIVNVSPNTAAWSFTDGDGVSHNGTGDATVANVPTGSISLVWLPLAVYDTPSVPSPQTLAKNGSVTFTGTYARQPRQTFYVNPANTSGIEDGSSQHPFNTIGEAVNASVPTRGDTIRVYAGRYWEAVALKESTTLLGLQGAYSTTIQTAKLGLTPLTIVNGCVVRGLTVVGNGGDSVRIAASATAEMTNCVVAGGETGVMVEQEAAAVLINNTIVAADGCGIDCMLSGAVTILRNNIIAGCGTGVCAEPDVLPSHGYNTFNGNGVDYDGPEADDTDFNANPMFVAAHDFNYHLAKFSPCRHAGDPAPEYNNLDGSRNDIGADGGPFGVRDMTAPHAVISTTPSPAEAATGPLSVAFDGSGSTDEWGIVSYSWDFDAVDGIQADATGVEVEYEYTVSGTYTATLTVEDNSGNTAKTTTTVFVGEAPSATASASPLAGPAPFTVQFTGEGEDPDGGQVDYVWDFGNGAQSDTQNPVYSYPAGTLAGRYSVALTVTDDEGTTAQAHVTVTVTETATLAARTIQPAAGGTVTVEKVGDVLDGAFVTLPPDAISEPVVLAVCEAPAALPVLPEGVLAGAIDLAPSGLLLSQPITVHIPHPASLNHEATVRAFYYDNASGLWKEDGITNVRHVGGSPNHAIEFETTHLSVYAAQVIEIKDEGGGCMGGTVSVSMPRGPVGIRHTGDLLLFALVAVLLGTISLTTRPVRQ